MAKRRTKRRQADATTSSSEQEQERPPVPSGPDEPPPPDADDGDETEPSPLQHYRDKRSAHSSREPFGGGARGGTPTPGEPRLFVVQKHAARRLHYDLRLEMRGVLRSWAVPRGPSLDPATKRLAVQTEDHPIEYVGFEGTIPDGNYGAGEMIVWDHGVWVPLEPLQEGFRKGKLLFELRGNKLRGVWTLVRTKEAGGRHWLLIKKPDAAATPGRDGKFVTASVLSGLTIEEMAEGTDRYSNVGLQLESLGARRRPVALRDIEVMLAEPGDEPFDHPDWLFELKYDGYRIIAGRDGDDVRLRYRSGRECTVSFPEVVRTLKAFPVERFIIDAEVVVLDDDARPNFGRLQDRAPLTRPMDVERGMRENPVTLYVFDLLAFGDFDLRDLPLIERKGLLKQILPPIGVARFADHIVGQGIPLMNEVRRLGVEGVMAKRADSRYLPGRAEAWKKIRVEHTADLVVAGFNLPEGDRVGFRGLYLGAYDGNTLIHVGRVGSGFTDAELLETRAMLDERLIAAPAIDGVPKAPNQRWVRPELVAEIKYKNLSRDNVLRAPVFMRWRLDKAPHECRWPLPGEHRDVPVRPPPLIEQAPPELPKKVIISNPDKVFWPDAGYTKNDLVEYYRAVSPWLMPYLRDRPMVLTRYPDGIGGKHFFQKNAPPYVPDWVRTQMMWNEDARREIEYFVCDDEDALAYVANMASIPLHVWASRLSDIQHPDWCILDLDPKGAPFVDVIRIAQHIHALCDKIGLPNYCKTSGSTGLHVLVPLGPHLTYAQCKQFAQVLARVVADEQRDIATIERHVPKRKGKVYIDYLQNGHGRLLVSPLCVRPKPGAPVSTPLRWDEIHDELDHQSFTIRTVPPRLAELGDPMAPMLEDRPDFAQILEALLPRLES